MALIRRLLPGLLLATLPGALAAQAAHGSGYTMVMTIDSGQSLLLNLELIHTDYVTVFFGREFGGSSATDDSR